MSRAVLLAGALAVCAGAAPPLERPKTKRVPFSEQVHRATLRDSYRWLEDESSPETKAWIEEQNRYTEAWFAGAGQRAALRQKMDRFWRFHRMPNLSADLDAYAGWVERGSKAVLQRQAPGQNQAVLYLREGGKEKTLLDPNMLSADGTTAVNSWSVSPDGKWLAYALSQAGSDWQVWRVRSTVTLTEAGEKLEWAKFGRAAWAADSSGFWYTRYPKPEGGALTSVNENQKLYFHRLRTPQTADKLVYERPDQPRWSFSPKPSADGRRLFLRINRGTSLQHQLAVIDLKAAEAKPRVLVDEFFAMLRPVASRGDTLYVFTDYEAPRGRVAAIDLNNPERKNWKTVVPETAATLKQVQLVGGAIVLAYMKDVAGEVVVRPLAGGAARTVPLPRNATLNLAEDSDRYFSVASFTSPESVYECRPECRALQTVVLPFDAAKIEVKQVFYAAKDGTKIPMFVAHKAGLALDGAAPALLYAYGGFNISITPTFRPLFAAWMDLGGVLAVANLRGGGEYGEEWHRAGMRGLKQNVFDDFIAAAEWLIENKYTSSKRLAIHGASNGGLLVGAVLNQRPELFGAAVPSVGVMDMLRFHKFTIGHAWIPEYGDPGNPEEFRILGRYSPLQNVRDLTHYPATLILTADHDDRVAPAHSFKYAAAMQNEQRGPAPVLIRIESNAGHGGGKPVSKRIEEDAAILTFLSRVFGLP